MKDLIVEGQDPESQNSGGWTLLIHATLADKAQIIKIFLYKYHADPNYRVKGGYTLLMLASIKGFLEVVGVLLYDLYPCEGCAGTDPRDQYHTDINAAGADSFNHSVRA